MQNFLSPNNSEHSTFINMNTHQGNQPAQGQPQYRRNPKVSKLDNGLVGLLSGLLVIVLGLVIIKFVRHSDYSFLDYIGFFTNLDNSFLMSEASKILSLSLFGLLAPFYLFLNKKYYLATRGVLMCAMIVAVLIVMYKFIW